jgi:MFS family permease
VTTAETLRAADDAPEAGYERPRLFRGEYLPFALGAIALVTLAALENRAVNTVLPTLVDEFHALHLFGLANVAPGASYLVALAVAGRWADRRGPRPVLQAGAASFALAQLLVGAAVAMPMVIAGRLLSGFAEGLIDIGLMVLIARALPDSLRPRMFALFAAMWILPSLFGPLLTGVVTEAVGWRWVFLGALLVLVPTWLLLQPAMGTHAAAATEPEDSAPIPSVVVWSLGAASAFFALSLAGGYLETHTAPAVLVSLAALVGLAATAHRLLPFGTVRFARGLPTVVAVRGLSSAAFAGIGAFLPLLLTLLHDFGPRLAGISLSVTGTMWAAGSFLQSHNTRFARVTVLRTGLALMTAGLSGTFLLTVDGLSPWLGLSGWAVAGIGMGFTSPTLSLLTLDLSTSADQGRNSGAAQMAGSIAMAVSFAVSGAMIALAAPQPGPRTFAAIVVVGIACAAAALAVAHRVVVDPMPDAVSGERVSG